MEVDAGQTAANKHRKWNLQRPIALDPTRPLARGPDRVFVGICRVWVRFGCIYAGCRYVTYRYGMIKKIVIALHSIAKLAV